MTKNSTSKLPHLLPRKALKCQKTTRREDLPKKVKKQPLNSRTQSHRLKELLTVLEIMIVDTPTILTHTTPTMTTTTPHTHTRIIHTLLTPIQTTPTPTLAIMTTPTIRATATTTIIPITALIAIIPTKIARKYAMTHTTIHTMTLTAMTITVTVTIATVTTTTTATVTTTTTVTVTTPTPTAPFLHMPMTMTMTILKPILIIFPLGPPISPMPPILTQMLQISQPAPL